MKANYVLVSVFLQTYVKPVVVDYNVIDAMCSINGLNITMQLINSALGLSHYMLAPTLDEELEHRNWLYKHYVDEIFSCGLHYSEKYLMANYHKW